MKYPITLIFVLFAFQSVIAQNLVDQSADKGLMVRQIPGSESDVVKFFSNLPTDSDTIYATIFRPANCPRCDGFLNIIHSLIKKTCDKPSVLIAVYPDSIAAKDYIRRYKLTADHYIFDTDESFADFLSFSPGYLHVGYVLKINKRTGELIVGANADNVSLPFFHALNIYNNRKEPYEFPSTNPDYHHWENIVGDTLSLDTVYTIDLNDGYKISEILYQPVFYENHLLFNDKLALAVVSFELNGSNLSFKRLIEPDSVEYSRFVSLPAERYKRLLSTDQLKNIPLQPFVMDDGKFGIAYSLPEVWLDEENTLNYRNKPCYIVRDFGNYNYRELVALEYDFEDVFYYPHFNMKPLGKDVVVGVQRITWPMVTDKREYINSPADNPFCDSFYDSYPQPTLALYSSTDGKLSMRFGELPDFAKKAKTGYSFSDMVFDAWDGEAVYASAYDGNISVASVDALDCVDCTRRYRAFHIDRKMFQVPDSSDYHSYNCEAMAQPLLNRKINDIKIGKDKIHCLLRHCSDAFERPELEVYDYIVIDRESGQSQTRTFPSPIEGERRIAYGLRRMADGSVTPFFISNKNGHWELRTE